MKPPFYDDLPEFGDGDPRGLNEIAAQIMAAKRASKERGHRSALPHWQKDSEEAAEENAKLAELRKRATVLAFQSDLAAVLSWDYQTIRHGGSMWFWSSWHDAAKMAGEAAALLWASPPDEQVVRVLWKRMQLILDTVGLQGVKEAEQRARGRLLQAVHHCILPDEDTECFSGGREVRSAALFFAAAAGFIEAMLHNGEPVAWKDDSPPDPTTNLPDALRDKLEAVLSVLDDPNEVVLLEAKGGHKGHLYERADELASLGLSAPDNGCAKAFQRLIPVYFAGQDEPKTLSEWIRFRDMLRAEES